MTASDLTLTFDWSARWVLASHWSSLSNRHISNDPLSQSYFLVPQCHQSQIYKIQRHLGNLLFQETAVFSKQARDHHRALRSHPKWRLGYEADKWKVIVTFVTFTFIFILFSCISCFSKFVWSNSMHYVSVT